MIEKIVLDYLNETLNVPVYIETPENKNPAEYPLTFVRIEKTGSSMNNKIYTATFAIQSYAPSLYKAAELNEEVKSAMDNIVKLDEITKAHLNSDYNFTDTSRKQPRYQAVYDLVHY